MFSDVKLWLVSRKTARHERPVNDAVELRIKVFWHRWWCKYVVEALMRMQMVLWVDAITGDEK